VSLRRIFPYGVAEGDGDGAAVSLFFLVVSFLVVVDSFFVASVVASFFIEDFLVVDFLVVEAGAFSGAVVVDDSLLVVHELMSPAANRTVMV
jgi:hypothetical protein